MFVKLHAKISALYVTIGNAVKVLLTNLDLLTNTTQEYDDCDAALGEPCSGSFLLLQHIL